MESIIFLLAGAAIFALGFFFGTKVSIEDEPFDEHEAEMLARRAEQWDALMNYSGMERKR